ncbi:MAG: peroxiredoxin [Bacteroidales bacterium]
MRKASLLTIILFIGVQLFGIKNPEGRIPLLSEPAPKFMAESTLGTINFPSDYFAKWKILFSHPADFTAVCSSELIKLAEMQNEFTSLNTALIVISTDSKSSHIAWVKSLESIEKPNNPDFRINFPLIADESHEISNMYGMLHPNSSSTKDVRAVFIINPEDSIAAIFYYPSTVGRNMDEIKRTLIALQTHDKHNVLTPANWVPGGEVMLPSPSSIQEAEKLAAKKDSKLRSPIWYMWFKKMD